MSNFSSAQLAALEAAIAEGALVIEYNGKRVEYRSLAEMRQIRDMIRRELGITTGQSTRVRHNFKNGLRDGDHCE